jgi:hypothetical protein
MGKVSYRCSKLNEFRQLELFLAWPGNRFYPVQTVSSNVNAKKKTVMQAVTAERYELSDVLWPVFERGSRKGSIAKHNNAK